MKIKQNFQENQICGDELTKIWSVLTLKVQEKNGYVFDVIYKTAKQYGYRFIEFWKGTKNQEKHFMHIYEDICNTSDCEVEIERKIHYV